jgi:hypothetical protein
MILQLVEQQTSVRFLVAEKIISGTDKWLSIVVKAAWTAAEASMRYLKVGEKNYSVTDIVDKVTAVWDCKPVESRSISYFLCVLDKPIA